MKFIKKISIVLFSITIILLSTVFTNAQMIGIPKANGIGTIKYRDSQEVLMKKDYVQKQTEFRGVWITPFVGDIPAFINEVQYKSEMNKVFDIMEYYNMNAIVYHVRIMNDALYHSALNPYSNYYNGNSEWDALEWVISESHRRGIEFHAWMNPYRVKNAYSGTLEALAATFQENNAASNPDNLIKNSSQVILDPGKPAVRQFLLDTCQELIENYDVDAVHFDDYFYIDNNDDSKTFEKYNPNNLLLADWRRLQVDMFIEDLHFLLEEHNSQNNKFVQLGISPSGVWRNGDGIVGYDSEGNAFSNGSNTLYGFAHYDNYLYSDTVKWINNEWIDYIVPQVYFALEHATTPYADIMQWWDKIVLNKKVNLYAGIGFHLAGSSGTVYTWKDSPYEFYYELRYNNGLQNAHGSILFSYRHMRDGYNNKASIKGQNMENVKNELWNKKIFLPQANVSNTVFPSYVRNLELLKTNKNNIISWDYNSNARYYAVFRSSDPITYSTNEIIDIFGVDEVERVEFYDELGDYNYAVIPISKSNTLGNGTIVNKDATKDSYTVEFFDKNNISIKLEQVEHGKGVSGPQLPRVIGHTFKGWNQDLTNITKDIKVYPIYEAKQYLVEFCNLYGVTIDAQYVEHGQKAKAPDPNEYDNKIFIKWDQDYNNIISDLKIYPLYEDITSETEFVVTFVMPDGAILKNESVKYKKDATEPMEIPKLVGKHFIGWDKSYQMVSKNLVITAVFEEGAEYSVIFLDKDNKEIKKEIVIEGNNATAPILNNINGFKFIGWDSNFTNIKNDLIVKPLYDVITFSVKFYDFENKLIKEELVKYQEDASSPNLDEIEGYVFVKWNKSFLNVKEDLIIKPVYEEQLDIKYTVTFKDKNGDIIEVVIVNEGENLENYKAPEVKGYKFKEWNQDLSNINDDLVVLAIYSKTSSCSKVNTVQMFTIISFLGILLYFRKKK